jgi:FlaA1/EpsC-like NDP-sugar epimerase
MFELSLVLWGIASLSLILTTTIQADMMAYIPTIINGLVSAISLIVGFSGVIIAFAVSNNLISFEENRNRLIFTLSLLAFPILLLWPMYNCLVSGNVILAFKEIMIAFLIGQILFLDLIAFVTRRGISKRVKDPA